MQYRTRGTCSTMINLTVDENHVIQDVHFTGGCNGNLQGISKLVIGQRAEGRDSQDRRNSLRF